MQWRPLTLADRLDLSRGRVLEAPSAMLPHRSISVHEGLNSDFLVFAVKQSSERNGFGFDALGQGFIEG